MSSLPAIADALLPRALSDWLRRRFFRVRWAGDFASWSEVLRLADGYDDPEILQNVSRATRAVVAGHASYEQDGMLFLQHRVNGPVAATLLSTAARRQGSLSVLDFGGALGSLYWRHKQWFQRVPTLRWSVVEQNHFVAHGSREFATDSLRFYHTIRECVAAEAPNAVLLSGVLQYLPDPYALLNELIQHDFEVVIIDRTGISLQHRDRLTLQQNPRNLSNKSYPCWFFQQERLVASLESRYRLIYECPSGDGETSEYIFKCLIFERCHH